MTDLSALPVPFASEPMELEPDWIDYNGHLNMAYYNVLFDRGCDALFDVLGMGPDYARTRRKTFYTAETHLCYNREIHLGDKVIATCQILDHDEKRIHLFQELRHVDGWLSATLEAMSLHVDMDGPKVAPFDPPILKNVEALARSHANLPRPDAAGKRIEIRRR